MSEGIGNNTEASRVHSRASLAFENIFQRLGFVGGIIGGTAFAGSLGVLMADHTTYLNEKQELLKAFSADGELTWEEFYTAGADASGFLSADMYDQLMDVFLNSMLVASGGMGLWGVATVLAVISRVFKSAH